jgi:hypothetical protein
LLWSGYKSNQVHDKGAFGGLVIIMVAIGPKVCGFKPGDEGFSRPIKIRSMISFGGEVKPPAPCHKVLWHVKNSYSVTEILVGKINRHFSLSFW